VPVDGALPVRAAAADQELLGRYRAAPDRVEWWTDRLSRTYRRLATLQR
jgi:o-succinylbenzoate synthase